MKAAEFVAAMRRKGADIVLEPDGSLVIELEDGAPRPTEADKRRLQEMKSEIIAHLSGVDWSRVSIYQLDRVLEIAVPWSDVPLLLAPGCRIAAELRSRDPKPGRVWCTCEVIDLMLTGVSPADVRKVAQTKMVFGGTVTARRDVERQA
jgi:hypothetical protein